MYTVKYKGYFKHFMVILAASIIKKLVEKKLYIYLSM